MKDTIKVTTPTFAPISTKPEDNEVVNEATIKGYVARDKDGALFFHVNKPMRYIEDNICYWADGGYRFLVPDKITGFIDIGWESDPIEVELILKRL